MLSKQPQNVIYPHSMTTNGAGIWRTGRNFPHPSILAFLLFTFSIYDRYPVPFPSLLSIP